MKQIMLECFSTPEKPSATGVVGMGFLDRIAVLENNNIIWHGTASACPNCWKPNSDPCVWWPEAYGWIGEGTYPTQCVMHDKFGKCIRVNNAGAVVARNRNPNHGGARILTGVYIHCGGLGRKNPEWRGSGGCPTVPKLSWPIFISCFSLGESAILIITDMCPRLPVMI